MIDRSLPTGESPRAGSHVRRDLTTDDAIEVGIQAMADDVWAWCEKAKAFGRTVTVKVKFADFELITRSRTKAGPIANLSELEAVSVDLLKTLFPMAKAVRLLGLSVSGFSAGEDRRSEQTVLAL
jgi:DNA polymerase-4